MTLDFENPRDEPILALKTLVKKARKIKIPKNLASDDDFVRVLEDHLPLREDVSYASRLPRNSNERRQL